MTQDMPANLPKISPQASGHKHSLIPIVLRMLIEADYLSGVNTGAELSIYCDGKIFTDFYQNWKDLAKEDQLKVLAERKRLGIAPRRGRNSRGRGGTVKTKRQLAAVVKDLEKAKRQIAAIKQKKNNNADVSDDEGPNEDAGNAFGGCSERKFKKMKGG